MPKGPTHGERIAKLEESAAWTKKKLDDLNDGQHEIKTCITEVRVEQEKCSEGIKSIKERNNLLLKVVTVGMTVIGLLVSIFSLFL